MLNLLPGKKDQEVLKTVTGTLQNLYREKLLPLEECYQFHEFHSPPLTDVDFSAKPMVLLIGEYSTGKTTFISHLLGEDFPGMRIGPEPTTDCFTAIMHGEEKGVVPGHVLAADASTPFTHLANFGNAFLNHFQGSRLRNRVLENVTFVDTPGILSGEKQRLQRGYDFEGVVVWLAERASKIILLFDCNKLDISDELKDIIRSIKPYEEKLCIFLNKADVEEHQLMRVNGAMMWSLGRVLVSPEIPRVYTGSFWDQPLCHSVHKDLFEREESSFYKAIMALPQSNTVSKLNDLVKRARLARAHAYIICYLKEQMPSWFVNWRSSTTQAKQQELINSLEEVYQVVQRQNHRCVSTGDLPGVSQMKKTLVHQNFEKFSRHKKLLFDSVNEVLQKDIPKLVGSALKQQKTGDGESQNLASGEDQADLSVNTIGGTIDNSSMEGDSEEIQDVYCAQQ